MKSDKQNKTCTKNNENTHKNVITNQTLVPATALQKKCHRSSILSTQSSQRRVHNDRLLLLVLRLFILALFGHANEDLFERRLRQCIRLNDRLELSILHLLQNVKHRAQLQL